MGAEHRLSARRAGRTLSTLSVVGPSHVRTDADGVVTVRLLARGPARGVQGTVSLASSRRVPSRWLRRGRPRIMRLGRKPFVVENGQATVRIRLGAEHFAMLRRMQTLEVSARVVATDARGRPVVTSRLLRLHPPARRRR